MTVFIIKYKFWTEDLEQRMDFWYLYQIWDSAYTVGLNSGLRLNLHLFFVYGSSDGSAESTYLHIFEWAFLVSRCDKYQHQMCWLFWFILCIKSAKLNIL